MAGFNQAYLAVRTIDTGIRTSSGTNATIGSEWQRFNDWPPVSGGFTANESDPFTNIFTCVTGGAGNAPTLYYQDGFIRNGNIPHRVSGACRAVDDVNLPPGAPILQIYCPIILVYGSRSLTDASTTAPYIFAGPYARSQGADGVIRVAIADIYGNATTAHIELPIAANVYYRMGIEVLGSLVNVYYVPTSADDPADLGGDDELELVFSTTINHPRGFEGPTVFAGMIAGGGLTAAGNLGAAIGDLILEELEGPTGAGLPPGTGGTPEMPVPGDVGMPAFTGGDLALPPWVSTPALDFGAYRKYKSIRQMTSILNNLRLGQ